MIVIKRAKAEYGKGGGSEKAQGIRGETVRVCNIVTERARCKWTK